MAMVVVLVNFPRPDPLCLPRLQVSLYSYPSGKAATYSVRSCCLTTRGISLDGHHGIQLLLWPDRRDFEHVDIRPSGVLELRCLLLHRLHRGALRWGGSLRDLHRLHRHGTAIGWENAMTSASGNGVANLEPRSGGAAIDI